MFDGRPAVMGGGARPAASSAPRLWSGRTRRPVEDSAKSRNGLAIPGRMRQVLSKWRGHGNTERLFPDFDVDAKFTEDRVDARIEVPDRDPAAEPNDFVPPSEVRTTRA